MSDARRAASDAGRRSRDVAGGAACGDGCSGASRADFLAYTPCATSESCADAGLLGCVLLPGRGVRGFCTVACEDDAACPGRSTVRPPALRGDRGSGRCACWRAWTERHVPKGLCVHGVTGDRRRTGRRRGGVLPGGGAVKDGRVGSLAVWLAAGTAVAAPPVIQQVTVSGPDEGRRVRVERGASTASRGGRRAGRTSAGCRARGWR
jgi:hypothetical protein